MNGPYRWAAQTLDDAETMCAWSARFADLPAGPPTSLFELEVQTARDSLAADLVVEPFEGFVLAAHPLLGRGAGPGTQRTEIGNRLPRSAWPEHTAFGTAGLVFARSVDPSPVHSEPTLALLARALAEPHDDTVRVVLADALVEDGDPRGVAILDALDGRDTTALVTFHGRHWLGPIAPAVATATYRLGFVESAVLQQTSPEVLLAPHWRTLETLDVGDWPEALPELASLPLLTSLRGASLASVQNHSWPRLRRLALRAGGTAPSEFPLASFPALQSLELADDSWLAAVQDWGLPLPVTVRSARRWNRTLEGRDLEVWVDDAFDDAPLGSVEVALEGIQTARLARVTVAFPHAPVRRPQWERARSRLRALCDGARIALRTEPRSAS